MRLWILLSNLECFLSQPMRLKFPLMSEKLVNNKIRHWVVKKVLSIQSQRFYPNPCEKNAFGKRACKAEKCQPIDKVD